MSILETDLLLLSVLPKGRHFCTSEIENFEAHQESFENLLWLNLVDCEKLEGGIYGKYFCTTKAKDYILALYGY